MRVILLAATALFAMPATAATFVFSGGTYNPGVTSPNPLLAPDILQLTTGSAKFFGSGAFTNQSGVVEWQGGPVFTVAGAQVVNNGLWDATGNLSLSQSGGGTSEFSNSGIVRKSGGAGATTITSGGLAFINDGELNAQTGTIQLFGTNFAFNNGSNFTGAGTVALNGTAAFSGSFASENLVLQGGAFNGAAATLNGTAEWRAGTFAGDWTVDGGATLAATTGSSKFFGVGSFTNEGGIEWDGGALFTVSGADVVNAGTITILGAGSISQSGGGTSSFVNDGLITKTGGSTTSISSGGMAFANNGELNAQTGTIQLFGTNFAFNNGSSFTGAGTVALNGTAAFSGSFASENLSLQGGAFNGTAATLNGTAEWRTGTFAGDWTVDGGATLAATTGSAKFFGAGSFTNDGSIDWDGGGLFTIDGADVVNAGTITILGAGSISQSGGGTSSFVNDGLITKTDGSTTSISSGGMAFANNGELNAESGIIQLVGTNFAFNDGSSFTGAGTVALNGTAAFSGSFASENLSLQGGAFNGTAAKLNGTAEWRTGTFGGNWTVDSGATLAATTGSAKFFGAGSFTNDGGIEWDGGALFTIDGADVVNAGTITILGGNNSLSQSGGGTSSFVNQGLIQRTDGGGTTTIFAGALSFVNDGVINVYSGTIALPAAFTNDGTLGGTATFSSTNLTNAGMVAPGAPGDTGTLSLSGKYIQSAIGSFVVDLASSSAFDLFQVSGTASLAGTLALSCIMGCDISDGDSFTILTSGGLLTGLFDTVTTTGFLNGFDYDVVYGDRFVRLEVISAGMRPPEGVIPEPATWGLMIAGFGLVGAATRRRRAQRALAIG